MTTLTSLPEWHALQKHQLEIAAIPLRDLFTADHKRAEKFSLPAASLLLDYSKNHITAHTQDLLCHLADAVNLSDHIAAMFKGAPVNFTEQRPALHVALRNLDDKPLLVDGADIMPLVRENLEKMALFCEKVHTGNWRGFSNKVITDVVNIGIGGSDLGPAMVTEALAPYATTSIKLHFVSNVDATHITQTLKKINPETTVFIISSKSFATIDTLTNAITAKQWFMQFTNIHSDFARHFLAVTCNKQKALEFGIAADNIFPVWEWVGGRYSLWSAIGLPIMLAVGKQNFYELLAGAHAMDKHFYSAPFKQNMPVILGLLNVWYTNFFNTSAHAVLPYDQSLNLLPTYLQQASMESNGKQIRYDGMPVDYKTGGIMFGVSGTNGQHAFYQLLHQGTQLVPVDFIIPALSHHPLNNHHAILFANCLSQSKALMEGKNQQEVYQELAAQGYSDNVIQKLLPHKILPGNRPSNTIVLPKLTPYTLGALIALYEHKIFTECTIWQINAFDQWSVELGKQLANQILPILLDTTLQPDEDSSTNNLINYYRKVTKT